MSAALPDAERRLLLPGLAYAGAILLHLDRLPLWCSLAALLALALRTALALRGLALPPRALRLLLTLALVALTLASFRTLNGLAAGSALLGAMGAAKLLETRGRRDGLIVTGTALFLLLAACLDRQALWRLPFYGLETWLACAALAALAGDGQAPLPRQALRSAGRTLLLALPLALLAFMFFPRLPGALWTVPGSERGTTGLADEMSPGSISELSVSGTVAFRVRFQGAAPPPAARYWRGPVLHDFDGYTWRRLAGQTTVAPALQYLGTPLSYHVTLEPTGQPWWFALDTVAASPSPRVQLSFDQQLLAGRPVTQAVGYDAQSYLQTRSTGPLSIVARRLDLRLPANRNPRSAALALQLRAQSSSDADYARRVLDYFAQGGFQYTLTPPLLDYDSIDDLLFNTRLGFCGHFASAYASLLRAGGVPARVVTGYLGAEWNPIGGYYLVRQSDAHAWTEVWLEGQGWTRVDPTAVVAPERLNRSLRELLPESPWAMTRLARGNSVLTRLLQGWDASNQWWQERVIDFNLRAQLSLLERLGLPDADYRELVVLLLGGASLWLGALLWQLRHARRTIRPDPVARAWQQLRTTLEQAGVEALQTAGPLTLAERGGDAFPPLREPLQAIATRYIALRYGHPVADPARETALLRADIHQLLPRLRRQQALWKLPPLPDAAMAELTTLLPLCRRLPAGLRHRTGALAHEFVRRIRFEGCGGLQLTDTMRHAIAFQACLLVANRGLAPYGRLYSVLVYPDEFVVAQRHEDEDGVVTEGQDVLSGQTVDTSRILISWADVLHGIQANDGYNVVLHEFAHLLDHEVGGELSRREGRSRASWHDVLEAEYETLCAAVDAGEDTLIDPYGAEDPAEFFAVCTETFFELPGALRLRHPPLYAILADFYGVEPARWTDGSLTR